MPQGLKYADAVRILGGSSPAVKAADNLLGGALSLATAGGGDVALSLFDAKAEVIRLGQVVAGKVQETVRGLSRYDRSLLLQAAHGVLVVTAFFEALDEELSLAGMNRPEFSRDDQVMLAAGFKVDRDWLGRLLDSAIPVPAPDQSYAELLRHLMEWYSVTAVRMVRHLSGLAVWDQANATVRHRVIEGLDVAVPGKAVARYQATHRRLAVDIPEFAVWIHRQESQAIGRGLERLEALLLRITSSRSPDRHRQRLAKAFRADLDRPILGSGDAGELVLPALGEAYVDPRFRVRAAGPSARPADESWWEGDVRSDLAEFLAEYLTTPQAADGPMLLLGQPGAGKSSLTKILAARLPAADFMVVRVALREVSAEVEIQDQVEQALRKQIGETVAWAELAESAAGALPVILLDGFDELLQATGIHQSDYLQRVAAFQQREAGQDRPVAVMVTSRLAVADRARLPVGSLAVRLESFDEPQLKQWLATWNAANAAAGRPLTLPVVRRFPDLAGQPLLLLMLALYNATGEAIKPDDESFDNGQLYERLLTEFAHREVRRLYAGQPEPAMAGLVEAELVRLSVVAFAMFHRLRLWTTEQELDGDLHGLGLQSVPAAGTQGFHAPLTAGQEMVGRFFFIQRAQATQDGRSLQTYEFLHATFGEYLVARLVMHALTDTAARQAAGTLPLPAAKADDELLQSLLGFTPLTARNTVMPFITAMLDGSDRAAIRGWLIGRLRIAMTRPEYAVRTYRPVDKRIDHWMATYSFNLMLLALACGEPVRASEIFQYAADPAYWLRGAALQWRAAVPTEMWLSTVDDMSISHVWHGDKRDMVLAADGVSPPPVVEPRWSLGFASVRDDATVGNGFWYTLEVDRALKSMHLSNDLSEDVIRHFAEPMLRRLPEACLAFVVQGPDDTESVAHSLLSMWLTSALATDAGDVARAYTRAAVAVAGNAWGPAGETNPGSAPAIVVFLKSLAGDVPRLPAHLVVDLVEKICSGPRFDARSHAWSAIECVTRIDPDDIDPESRHALFRYLEAFMVTGIDVELEPRAFPARQALQEWANSRQAGPEIARQPDEGAGWSA